MNTKKYNKLLSEGKGIKNIIQINNNIFKLYHGDNLDYTKFNLCNFVLDFLNVYNNDNKYYGFESLLVGVSNINEYVKDYNYLCNQLHENLVSEQEKGNNISEKDLKKLEFCNNEIEKILEIGGDEKKYYNFLVNINYQFFTELGLNIIGIKEDIIDKGKVFCIDDSLFDEGNSYKYYNSILYIFEIENINFDLFKTKIKEKFIADINKTDYTYDKLSIKIKKYLDVLYKEKGKLNINISNTKEFDIEENIFRKIIILLYIDGFIKILDHNGDSFKLKLINPDKINNIKLDNGLEYNYDAKVLFIKDKKITLGTKLYAEVLKLLIKNRGSLVTHSMFQEEGIEYGTLEKLGGKIRYINETIFGDKYNHLIELEKGVGYKFIIK